MNDAPKLTDPASFYPPYSPQWFELVRQREEYIQACPHDVGLKAKIFFHFDDPPVYSARETLFVRHPDEYLENAGDVTPS